MKIKNVQFIVSAPTIKEAPPPSSRPEIVVVGRSNVGKSSFICKLTSRKIAKVSATPGKTRMINYFLINDDWYLVDLPGYGFAKVSKAEKERWGRALEEYLAQRENICLAILLVDCRHEIKDSDLQMYAWLKENNLNTAIVLTKSDKLSRSQLIQAEARLARAFNLSTNEIFTVSSQTGYGFDILGSFLDNILIKAKAIATFKL
ncbi:MAG: ribosome biogenesis GTP-binding protein YihA/YsxC [Candidatus Bruticola sp.]